MTISDRRPEFSEQMRPYWNLENRDSFVQIFAQIQNCRKTTTRYRLEAIEKIGAVFEKRLNIPEELKTHWPRFKEVVQLTQNVAKSLEKAKTISGEALSTAIGDQTPFNGDYFSFANQVVSLNTAIADLYKNALYPFLKVLQNAEKGWNPASIAYFVCDSMGLWDVTFPKEEVLKAFKKG